jgi:hypothetical protein
VNIYDYDVSASPTATKHSDSTVPCGVDSNVSAPLNAPAVAPEIDGTLAQIDEVEAQIRRCNIGSGGVAEECEDVVTNIALVSVEITKDPDR